MCYAKFVLRILAALWLCYGLHATARAQQPGTALPSASDASDLKMGSVLVYNFYTSGLANSGLQNTRFSITNTDNRHNAYVMLYFVDGSSGLAAGVYICLTPYETAYFLASDVDPGITGYVIAVAVDRNGCPVSHNFLMGSANVKLASGHIANYSAVVFAALYAGTLPGCNPLGLTARVAFDGVSYNRAPRALALDKLHSPADGNSTLLVLNRLDGNALSGTPALDALFGSLFDDNSTEVSFSVTQNTCQLRATLSDTFPRTAPRLSVLIPAGHSGWLRLYALNNVAVSGLALNFNPNSVFTGGGNLDTLSLTDTGGFTIRVFPPSC